MNIVDDYLKKIDYRYKGVSVRRQFPEGEAATIRCFRRIMGSECLYIYDFNEERIKSDADVIEVLNYVVTRMNANIKKDVLERLNYHLNNY